VPDKLWFVFDECPCTEDVVGMDVVLSYTVLGTKIHEQPSSITVGDQVGFVRTFETSKAKADLATVIAEVENATADVRGLVGTIADAKSVTAVGLVGAPSGVRLEAAEHSRILLKIPKGTKASLFKVVIWHGSAAQQDKFATMLDGRPQIAAYAKGGTPRWPA